MTTPLRIGFIPLVDAAALIVATDKGFAAAEGLDVTLVREVSWSNVRDKLNIGLFDAAHLRSGRARGVALDASWPLTPQWRIAASAETLSVSRSLDTPLTRGGAAVGTVSQPSWRRERVAVLLQRSFSD